MTGRIEKLQKEFDIAIHWVAFPLHPYIPEGGLTFDELLAGRNIDIQQMMAHLKNVASQAKLPLHDPQRAYNTRLAQEVGKWSETQSKGDEFHNAVFGAYFVDSKNISDPLILIDIAESVGLSKDDARKVIDNRTFKEAVDQDWLRSREASISSVPTFAINQQRLVGAQSYEILSRFMTDNKVDKKPV